ncbi:MAG: 4Fe-4S dicluster domain-containing protein [Bacteriovoracaceae bacterium]|jgi:formate hydrogenlyase subunit 6/NADH:ubiquinone oxidoreductase subunit I|nr:4Fe-4S dicluster domain-containing protein [Bacteriovoracaceae bacterium]
MSEDSTKYQNPYHTARLKTPRKGKKPPKLLAVVHTAMCTGCEICIAGCPVDSIEIVPGPDLTDPNFKHTVEIDLMRCIGCQNCSQDCPWFAITMYNQDDAYIAWGSVNLESKLYISKGELDKLHSDSGIELPEVAEGPAATEEAEPESAS